MFSLKSLQRQEWDIGPHKKGLNIPDHSDCVGQSVFYHSSLNSTQSFTKLLLNICSNLLLITLFNVRGRVRAAVLQHLIVNFCFILLHHVPFLCQPLQLQTD